MYIKDVKIILRRLYKNIFFIHLGIFQIPCFLYFLILTSGPTLVYMQQDLRIKTMLNSETIKTISGALWLIG